MPWGALPDWIVALFTGISAFFLWKATWPPRPVVEVEREYGTDPPRLSVKITVRNPNPHHAIIIKSIMAEPHDIWDLRDDVGNVIGERWIQPASAQMFHCQIDGGQRFPLTSISMPTISTTILCNRRIHKNKIKF